MKLSIVTINYNNREGLLRTLKSTAAQNCQDFEHILVDGASTDGSVEVIREYASGSENVKWVSEPDSGIYNAMNKGTRMASGEYLLFLNSGDDLYSNAVVRDFIASKVDSDIVKGYIINADPQTGRGAVWSVGEKNKISMIDVFHKGIPHQGCFIKRKVQMRCPYDESYKVCADVNFFVRNLILDNCSYESLEMIISNFYLDGISSKNIPLKISECNRLYREMIPARILQDYESLDIEGFYMLRRLKRYSGFRKFIVKACSSLIDLYDFIVKLKSISNRQNNR